MPQSLKLACSCAASNGKHPQPDIGADVYSRFFAPWFGIPEDPVTGSAHAVLAKYFCPRLNVNNLRARQCSKRGGELVMRLLHYADGTEAVEVSGHCVTTIRGEFVLPELNG
jgi:PhzF family phenazine biosynthesis protein